jgi:hypothetical protein
MDTDEGWSLDSIFSPAPAQLDEEEVMIEQDRSLAQLTLQTPPIRAIDYTKHIPPY